MFVQIPLFIWSISIPVVLGGIYNGGFGVGPSISYAAAPAVSYAAAPSISYAAAPAKLVAAAPAVTYAAAPAKVVAAAAPVAIKTIQPEPYDPNPQYSFAYGVSDHSTGDSKAAEESLVNGVVHGSYSLTEADGSVRKVTYTADDLNGFNAVVQKSGGAVAVVKPIAVPAATKVAYAAPAFAKVAYASPSLYHH